MGNKSHIDFLSLIRDEEFIQLVKSSENAEELLGELKQKYQDNSKSFDYAVEFIQSNLSKKQKLDVRDFELILNNVAVYSSKKKKVNARTIFINNFWKAAIIIILLSVGSIFVYKQMIEDPLQQFAQAEIDESEKGLIVLSDGSKKILEDNDLYIEYDAEKGEVIVKNDNQYGERIKNPKSKAILNQVVVPYGQTKTVSLSDGTTVQLNAGSRLVFPAVFSEKTRDVFLTGEGYFEVAKNKLRPFIVRTEYIDVEVLGTKFDVSAYTEDARISTVLLEGKVKVSQKNRLFSNIEHILNPGQGCFYTVDKKESEIRNVDLNFYTSWKDGILYFKDISLSEITERLEKYYNETIEIDGKMLANTLVSGKLILSNDFIEVIQSLSLTIEGRFQTIEDGYILKTN